MSTVPDTACKHTYICNTQHCVQGAKVIIYKTRLRNVKEECPITGFFSGEILYIRLSNLQLNLYLEGRTTDSSIISIMSHLCRIKVEHPFGSCMFEQ